MIILGEILLRCALGFGVLLFVTRMVGNKQLGQMNIFTYISGIAIGTMSGGMVVYHEIEILESFLGMLIWGSLTIILEYMTLKSRKIRKMLTGQPVIVVAGGKILYQALKKERLSFDDLMMLLRSNHVYRMADVEYAVLETNGELSILKKAEQESVTRKDLNVSVQKVRHIPIQVVAEGEALEHNLALCGHTKAWVEEQILEQFGMGISSIMYAEIGETDNIYIQEKKVH